MLRIVRFVPGYLGHPPIGWMSVGSPSSGFGKCILMFLTHTPTIQLVHFTMMLLHGRLRNLAENRGARIWGGTLVGVGGFDTHIF